MGSSNKSETSSNSKSLSRREFFKLGGVGGLSLLLAACKAAGIDIAPTLTNNDSTKTPNTNSTSITPEAEPTPETVPQSLLEQLPLLKKYGYSLRPNQGGWELINNTNQTVLFAPNTDVIAITGENNEQFILPQETFKVRETIGAGVPIILTFKDATSKEKVSSMFLDRLGVWVSPIEQQTDPEVIENYPHVELNDIQNGRALYSELLSAKPFPESTLKPDGFFYNLERVKVGGGYVVELHDSVDGLHDMAGIDLREIVTQNNDYRRWTNFYRSITPEGKDILIGTEQVLMSDGKTSLFLHYVFGPEWPWEEDYKPGNQSPRNLIDSVFQSKSVPNDEDERVSFELRPVIYIEYGNFTGDIIGQFIGSDAKPNAGEELYRSEQYQPVTISPNLLNIIQSKEPGIVNNGRFGFIDWAGPEVQNIQYFPLIGTTAREFYPSYYFNSTQ